MNATGDSIWTFEVPQPNPGHSLGHGEAVAEVSQRAGGNVTLMIT